MGEWRTIDSAPLDGTVFLSLNHDREVWVAKYAQESPPRLCYRTNRLHEPKSFAVKMFDGEQWTKEDKEFAVANEAWMNSWTYWSRGYDFKPTHWMPLPPPPKEQ